MTGSFYIKLAIIVIKLITRDQVNFLNLSNSNNTCLDILVVLAPAAGTIPSIQAKFSAYQSNIAGLVWILPMISWIAVIKYAGALIAKLLELTSDRYLAYVVDIHSMWT